MVSTESNLTIDYEQKYWTMLEEYADLLLYLEEKAPLTYQAWMIYKAEKKL